MLGISGSFTVALASGSFSILFSLLSTSSMEMRTKAPSQSPQRKSGVGQHPLCWEAMVFQVWYWADRINFRRFPGPRFQQPEGHNSNTCSATQTSIRLGAMSSVECRMRGTNGCCRPARRVLHPIAVNSCCARSRCRRKAMFPRI